MPAPLPRPAFWILTALASHRRHGYEVLQEIAAASSGAVTVKVATLYATLERLEKDGLIRIDGEEIVNGRARRYFVITDEGSVRLLAETESMEQAVRVSRARLTDDSTPQAAPIPKAAPTPGLTSRPAAAL